MADVKSKASILEWRIDLPDGSVELKRRGGLRSRAFDKICKIFSFWNCCILSFWRKVWKLGADDPRRIIHSIRVGIGLAVVSLFYFSRPLFQSTGGNATWAVMTVVVVFEFTAGATLSKGLNRIFATLAGGFLAVGVNYVADCAGHNAEPFILGAAVLLQGALSTFARFYPKIKQRYDYGMLIFILTFSFMAVSGYRVDNLFEQAYLRLGTILLGCVLCITISMTVCPIWAGEDLHKLVIRNLEGLAQSCEGCVAEYFRESSEEGEDCDKDNVSNGYKCVLNSKATEESFANFARWEPAHGPFRFRYPWLQYVKIGAAMRHCAYCIEALNSCVSAETVAPLALRSHLKTPCMNIAAESSKVLMELADVIRTMTRSANVDLMTERLNKTVDELQNYLTSHPELFIDNKRWQIVDETLEPGKQSNNSVPVLRVKQLGKPPSTKCNFETPNQGVSFRDTLPLATVAFLLQEIVARLATVIQDVHDLEKRANFKPVGDKPTPTPTTTTTTTGDHDVPRPPSSSSAKQPPPPSPPPPPPLTDDTVKVQVDEDTTHNSNVSSNNNKG